MHAAMLPKPPSPTPINNPLPFLCIPSCYASGCNAAIGQTITCPLGGTWLTGQTATIAVPVRAVQAGSLTNRAEVTDANGNKAGPATATVDVTSQGPGLLFTISKRGPGAARVGDVLTFDIWVAFLSEVRGATVTDGAGECRHALERCTCRCNMGATCRFQCKLA